VTLSTDGASQPPAVISTTKGRQRVIPRATEPLPQVRSRALIDVVDGSGTEMPRIGTDELLERIKSDNCVVVLKGLLGGSFFLLLECKNGIFIHENPNGTMKEYPNINHALSWLKRKTDLKRITVDIELWKQDRRR
jgi:hypothetical protein